MISRPLTVNDPLWRSSRLAAPANLRTTSLARDAVICLLAGFAATLSVHFLDFNLRIPGHAILRSVLPVTLGMAMAPRRLSGMLIGTSALSSSVLLRGFGVEGVGWGAFTSLLMIGPMLDVALWQTRSGWSIFLRCALAGMMANMMAFGIRGGSKVMGWDLVTMRPLSAWWSTALVSHTVCGLLAGLIGSLIWFRAVPRHLTEAVDGVDRGTSE